MKPISSKISSKAAALAARRSFVPGNYTTSQYQLISPCLQNKTSSAVQLKHLPTGIVVKCQGTRSRAQNRKIARRLLADKLEFLEKGPESRIAIKEGRKSKRKASRYKKAMRKYKRLGEEENDEDEDGGVEGVNTVEVGQEKRKEESSEEKGM